MPTEVKFMICGIIKGYIYIYMLPRVKYLTCGVIQGYIYASKC